MIQLFMISYHVTKTAEGTSFGGYPSIFTRPLKDFQIDNETNNGFDFHIYHMKNIEILALANHVGLWPSWLGDFHFNILP